MSRSGRRLRLPSSLALTDGPVAPWGGLRTPVGGWGPFRPHGGGTLRGLRACPREGGGGARLEKPDLPLRVSVGGSVHPDSPLAELESPAVS